MNLKKEICAVAAAACLTSPFTAQADVMLGAFIDGNSWNTTNINGFNTESTKDLAFINFFGSMSGRFDWHHKAQMNKIIAAGAMPMFTLEAEFWNGSVTGQDELDILEDIAAGVYDDFFLKWVNGYGKSWEYGFKTWIQNQPAGSTIMFRFAHEMNGDWYPWGDKPTEYVAAWKHIHDLFEAEGVNQYIQWVWCPAGAMNVGSHSDLNVYYPGDDYVDWTCFDEYNWGTNFSWSSWTSFKDMVTPAYNFMVTNYPTKPIVIGEFGSSEPADLPTASLGQYGDNSDQFEDKNTWHEQLATDLELDLPAVRGISIFNYGTYKMYGSTLQGNPATGIDGWNLGNVSPYFTSDYISVK